MNNKYAAIYLMQDIPRAVCHQLGDTRLITIKGDEFPAHSMQKKQHDGEWKDVPLPSTSETCQHIAETIKALNDA